MPFEIPCWGFVSSTIRDFAVGVGLEISTGWMTIDAVVSHAASSFRTSSDRWINPGDLTAEQWLLLNKFFALELFIREIGQQHRLSYKVVY